MFRVRAFQFNGKCRLFDGGIVPAHDVGGYADFRQGLPKGRSGGVQKDLVQDVEGIIKLRIFRVPDHLGQGDVGLLLRVLVGSDRVLLFDPDRLFERLLGRNRRVEVDFFILRQVLAVQIFQPLRHVAVPVEVDIGIARMIVMSVEIQELLVCKCRDYIRIAAGIVVVGCVRIERPHDGVFQHVVRRGIGPFHFIIDDTVDSKAVGSVLHLIVPALLAEELLMVIDIGMQYRIHIDVHEVFEILLIRGRHGKDRLVEIGHGVQESIDGTLHQLHEGVPDRILVRAAEDSVLDDMGHPGRVGNRCPEADIKDLVGVGIFNDRSPRPRLFVPQDIARRMDVDQVLFLFQFPCIRNIFHLFISPCSYQKEDIHTNGIPYRTLPGQKSCLSHKRHPLHGSTGAKIMPIPQTTSPTWLHRGKNCSFSANDTPTVLHIHQACCRGFRPPPHPGQLSRLRGGRNGRPSNSL